MAKSPLSRNCSFYTFFFFLPTATEKGNQYAATEHSPFPTSCLGSHKLFLTPEGHSNNHIIMNPQIFRQADYQPLVHHYHELSMGY